MRIMRETGKTTNRLHIVTTHDIIYIQHITSRPMIAQKRLVRVTLDIMCYDDLDVENMDWKELLSLEGDEDVHYSVKEFDPF